jgi:uncharacterized protein with ParB-like and HNH nuclease domain
MSGEFFMKSSSTLDRPEAITYSIDDLLREVENGRMRIPRFQRPFRWNEEDMLKLLDSIYSGYPIGSLLFWETDFNQGANSVFGPVIIENSKKIARMIIDGQQRITTLVGIFLRPEQGEHDKKWYVYFNLKAKRFETSKRKQSTPTYWIPLREVSDTVRFLKWLRRLPEDDENESLINSANQLAKALRDYRIPAYIVKTDDEKVLRIIFKRLNTGGKPLTYTEVFDSLFGKRDGADVANSTVTQSKNSKIR